MFLRWSDVGLAIFIAFWYCLKWLYNCWLGLNEEKLLDWLLGVNIALLQMLFIFEALLGEIPKISALLHTGWLDWMRTLFGTVKLLWKLGIFLLSSLIVLFLIRSWSNFLWSMFPEHSGVFLADEFEEHFLCSSNWLTVAEELCLIRGRLVVSQLPSNWWLKFWSW
jgi:hypothetical protein